MILQIQDTEKDCATASGSAACIEGLIVTELYCPSHREKVNSCSVGNSNKSIIFVMHIDIYHIYVHSKIDVSRKAKTTNNLGQRE